jgi:hypothetical protein
MTLISLKKKKHFVKAFSSHRRFLLSSINIANGTIRSKEGDIGRTIFLWPATYFQFAKGKAHVF